MLIPLRNLFRREKIPTGWVPNSQQDYTPEPTEPIIVVHGTFAARTINDPELPRKWWERGGSFCEKLDGLLGSRASNARCWSHLVDGQPEYSWSGKNQESARETASKSLQSYLLTLEQDYKIRRYHIIAHSHGGNVAFESVSAGGAHLPKLGKLIFLGTPFLHRRSQINATLYSILYWLSISLFVLLTFSSFILFVESLTGKANAVSVYALGSMLAIILISLPFAAKPPRPRKAIERLQDKLHTFLFSADEAFILLTNAAALRKDLGPLKGLLPKPRWNSYLSRSIPGFWGLLYSAPLYLMVFYGAFFNLFLLGLVPVVGDSMLYAYGSVVRKLTGVDLAEHRFFWGQYRRGRWEHYVLRFFSVLLCGIIILAIYFIPALLVVVMIDFAILGLFVVFLGSLIGSYASKRGIRSLCSAALGNDVIGDPIITVSMEPSGCKAKRIVIDQKVETEVRNQVCQYVTAGTQRFYSYYEPSQSVLLEHLTLLEKLSNAFQDPELLHNKYYAEDGIIDQIAEVIASE